MLIPFPKGSQEYLRATYGIEPYSDRHLRERVRAGKFPKPIEISPRRHANTKEQLDTLARALLAQAEPAA
jgi:hypothetical protein